MEINPTEAVTMHLEWTAERIRKIKSPYFPLCKSGPLCHLLDNEELLFGFYTASGMRAEVKHFCKTKQWDNKPLYQVLTDKTMRPLIRSMCNSAQARRMLRTSGMKIELFNLIWLSLRKNNNFIIKSVEPYCYTESGKLYIKPDNLVRYFNETELEDSPSVRQSIIYLALAFAMLQEESCAEIISALVTRYPETLDSLGLIREPESQPNEPSDVINAPHPIVQFEESTNRAIIPQTKKLDNPRSIHPFGCWITEIGNISKNAEFFNTSSEKFTIAARRLAEIETLSLFEDSSDAAALLSTLEVERGNIRDYSHNFRLMLKMRCQDLRGHGCELQKYLLQLKDVPPTTREQLNSNILEMRRKEADVVSSGESAQVEVNRCKNVEAIFRDFLGEPLPKITQIQQITRPCRVFERLQEQQETLAALKITVDVRINNRKAELLDNCDILRTKFASGIDSTINRQIADLKIRIQSADEIDHIISCQKSIDDLTEHWSNKQHDTLQSLAKKVRSNPSAFPEFLQLCSTLIDKNEPEVAFLIIYLWQRLHAQDESHLFPDKAISILLESACSASLGELAIPTVWKTLCSDPWLLGIRRGDIESADTLQRLVISLLGGSIDDDTETAAVILTNIGAVDLCRLDFPNVLQDFLQAVVSRRQVKFISADELAKKHEQESNINERIAVKGNKYRHIQCGNAVHFSRFEAHQVFPALEELWRKISIELQAKNYVAAHKIADKIDIENWYRELNRQHDRPVDEHPHFPVKIRAFMREYLDFIKEHISHCEKFIGAGELLLKEDELRQALHQWAEARQNRESLAAFTMQNLKLSPEERRSALPFWNAISVCKPVVKRCPRFINWLRTQENPEPDPKVEQLILGDLAHEVHVEEVAAIYLTDSAWEQLSVLHQSEDVHRDEDWAGKHKYDMAELTSQRADVLSTRDQSQLDAFDACIRGGRFPAAREILKRCSEQREVSRSQGRLVVSSFVDSLFKRINVIKDAAADANMPGEWEDNICVIAATIERQLRALLRSADTEYQLETEKSRLSNAVDALNFVIEQRTQVFDEVKHYLDAVRKDSSFRSLRLISAGSRENAYEKCPDLIEAWDGLASETLDEAETKRTWAQFVKEFAKICNLYRDEHDEKKRFVSVPSIKYPFLVFQTAFHKPQSDFLKRPLRLYLYRQRDVDTPALQRLEAEISGETSAAWLHIVFAPQGVDKIRRFFQYDKGFKNFLLVDEALLHQIGYLDKHDVPVRQALHLSVADLASSSPFVAQGYCHQSNNIYVGRKDILTKLLNTPQAMIWGGRRIGKTSVLHALESALATRKYSVAYVYVDLQDAGDPDLAIAQKIASTLGLDNIENLTDFERQITARRNNGQRFAFLIDEVDEYIKKSKKVHGNTFPLATVLRQLMMDDSLKDTILVYSGYHQLYYEAKLNKDKRRVGHPFINIAQDIPIRDLTHDDVNELVRTGFEEMLGITVSPEVPPLISNRASRHPAFVQQFCRCLLEQVSKRRSPGMQVTITKDDVEAVYSANASSNGGEQPFIFYVNETLGYNLSHLGRAIMITICSNPSYQIRAGNKDQYFLISMIKDELNVWCDVIGIKHPELEHFQQSIDLLVMTNMLTQDSQEPGKYRVTYPTYIDILRRLDSLRKADVEDSLRQYDSNERNSGVLL